MNCNSLIRPVVLYGCETWSLTLREERRLSVLDNRVLRRVFGPKRDEVTGEWRKLHNEELSDLYSLPNIARVVSALPNVGPYIYDVSISGLTRSSIYIYMPLVA